MNLTLEVERRNVHVGETFAVRLMALNDSYEAAEIDRGLLIGPNPVVADAHAGAYPVSTEPRMRENKVTLNAYCFYGRERTFAFHEPGTVTFYAYLLRRSVSGLLPTGPSDTPALLAEALPLSMTIEGESPTTT